MKGLVVVALSALAVSACRAPLPPPVQPFTRTPDAPFRAEAPAPVEASARDTRSSVSEHRLANGFTLLVVEQPGVDLVTLAYVNRIAREDEPGRQAALATITASSLLEGTIVSKDEILTNVRIGGLRPFAFATRSGTYVGVTVPERGTRTAVRTLAKIVRRPAFDAPAVHRVRNHFIQDLELEFLGDPIVQARTASDRARFGPVHPWGRSRDDIANSSFGISSDVVATYHAQVYRPEESALVLVGAVTATVALPWVERAFGDWARGEGDPGALGDSPTSAEPSAPAAQLVHREGDLGTIYLAIPTAAFGEDDMNAVVLLNHVLGGSLVSRTQVSLRHELGLTYGAPSAYEARPHAGQLVLTTQMEIEGVPAAIAALMRQLDRLKTERVSPDELEAARAAYRRSLELSTRVDAITFVGRAFCARRDAAWIEAQASKSEEVTAQDVEAAAKKYFAVAPTFIVVGDADAIQDELSQIVAVKRVEPRGRGGAYIVITAP